MKVNITFDCTPEEARQFLGLPDVSAFQDEMMNIMREKTLENMKLMEPDQALKMWAPFMDQGMMNQGMDFFKNMMTGAATSAMAGTMDMGKKNNQKKSGK